MELKSRDLSALLPILKGYEYVVGFLSMVCKFFPYRVIWVEYTQNCIGPKCFHSSVCMLTWWVFLGLWTEIHVMFSWVQRRCWLVGSKGDRRILRRLKEMLDLIGLKETKRDVWPDKSQGDWRRCLTRPVKKSCKIFLVKNTLITFEWE